LRAAATVAVVMAAEGTEVGMGAGMGAVAMAVADTTVAVAIAAAEAVGMPIVAEACRAVRYRADQSPEDIGAEASTAEAV